MFASTTLSDTEKKYRQLVKEALAIILGIRKCHKFIYGRSFKLVTDHEPLKQIFNSSKSILKLSAARLQRWAIILSAYNYELIYKKAEFNSNADGLSRLSLESKEFVEKECFLVSVVPSFQDKLIKFKTIEQDTCMDDILDKVVEYLNNGWSHFSQLN